MRITLLSLCLILSGCAEFTPKPEASLPATMPQAKNWRTPLPSALHFISTTSFWQGFTDPVLLQYITQANTQNQDLAAAAARLQQVRAVTAAANASLWPTISLSGGTDGIWRDGAQPLLRTESNRWQNSANAALSYEVDMFGRLHNAKQAKKLTAAQQEFLRASLALSIQAEVATTYFSLLSANAEVANRAAQTELSKQTITVWGQRVAAGLEPPTALAEREQTYATYHQQAASARAAQSKLADSLAVLVGVNPLDFIAPSATTLPSVMPMIPSILPAQALAQRPDILAAEAALQAAGADVAAARAAWWPTFNLSVAEAVSFDPTRLATTLAASLAVNLFDGGAARAEIRRNQARETELLATYRQTILTASAEANTALSAWAEKTTVAAAAAALNAAHTQTAGAKARVSAGLADATLLYNSQQQTLSAAQTYTQAEAEHLQAVVRLYLALGGIQ